ncbi:MAG: isopenicillin N synthase family dioxygenase [Xenococcaceae cyanobacterium]
MDTLPVISLTKLKDINGSNSGNEEHKRLYDICYEHGFFYLKDHGISTDLVQQTINASRNFFQLPEELKKAYGQDKQTVYPKTSRGYVPLYGETLHEEVGPDPKEIFDLGLERPPSDNPFTGPTLIPDETVAPGFAASHYQLQMEIMTKIVPPLLRALAVALNLEADWFDPYFDDPILIHRTIYYPPECGVAGKHTDNGIFTVLIQEYFPTPSLRVYTKNAWIDAMCLEDAFVINLGDMLQLWTNGLFVSTPHEVIHKLSNSRISIPFFIYPNVNAIIKPMGTDQQMNATDIMLKNFDSIWITKSGAGRAKELK